MHPCSTPCTDAAPRVRYALCSRVWHFAASVSFCLCQAFAGRFSGCGLGARAPAECVDRHLYTHARTYVWPREMSSASAGRFSGCGLRTRARQSLSAVMHVYTHNVFHTLRKNLSISLPGASWASVSGHGLGWRFWEGTVHPCHVCPGVPLGVDSVGAMREGLVSFRTCELCLGIARGRSGVVDPCAHSLCAYNITRSAGIQEMGCEKRFLCSVSEYQDIDILEDHIFRLLRCRDGRCTDLLSGGYVRLKLHLARPHCWVEGTQITVFLSEGLTLFATDMHRVVYIYYAWQYPSTPPGDAPKRSREASSRSSSPQSRRRLSRPDALLPPE